MDDDLVARFEEARRVISLRLIRRRHPGLADHEIGLVLHVPVGATRSMRWLADHFGMPITTTSEMVRSLEERGYLVVVVDPDDKRRRLVELSERGRNLVATYIELDPSEMALALGVLDAEEGERLVGMLERVADRATEIAAGAGRVPAQGFQARHRGFATAAEMAAARLSGGAARRVSAFQALTPAQHQVVELVRAGLTNAEIADRLFVSRRTVENHLSRIYDKLGISSRNQLAHEAWVQESERPEGETPS